MFKNRRPASRQAANASGKRSSIVATSGRIERIRRSLELPKIRTRPSETFSDKAVNASVVLSQSSVSTSIAAIPHALSLLKARSYNRQWASVKQAGAAFRSLDQRILRSPWDGRSAFPRSDRVDHVTLGPDAKSLSSIPDKGCGRCWNRIGIRAVSWREAWSVGREAWCRYHPPFGFTGHRSLPVATILSPLATILSDPATAKLPAEIVRQILPR